jgi:hypothetical protein
MKKNRVSISFGLFFIACFYFSCSQQKAGEEKAMVIPRNTVISESPALHINEYMNWIENKDNGLKVEKKIGEVTFSALYKPYEYMAIMELKKEKLTEKKLTEKIAAYEGLQYFTFKIAANNEQQELLRIDADSDKEYYSRLEYFSFQMQNDFRLIDGKDTLDCVLYHFERVYGLAPYATMVLGFPLAKTGQQQAGKRMYNDKTIGYTDKFFGAGNIYMRIKEESLINLPSLVLN